MIYYFQFDDIIAMAAFRLSIQIFLSAYQIIVYILPVYFCKRFVDQ